MGKRGGFNQDLKPRLSSTSNIFARRGDPMVSRREQLRDYGRSENENPDRDWLHLLNGETQYTRARYANPQRGNERPESARKQDNPPFDYARKKAGIAHSLNRELKRIENANKGGKIHEATSHPFRLCIGCSSAPRCIHDNTCIGSLTGAKLSNRPVLGIKKD